METSAVRYFQRISHGLNSFTMNILILGTTSIKFNHVTWYQTQFHVKWQIQFTSENFHPDRENFIGTLANTTARIIQESNGAAASVRDPDADSFFLSDSKKNTSLNHNLKGSIVWKGARYASQKLYGLQIQSKSRLYSFAFKSSSFACAKELGFDPARPARQFPRNILSLNPLDNGFRVAAADLFFNIIMDICHSRDLRQMCHADHLAFFAIRPIFCATTAIFPLIPVSTSSKIIVEISSRIAVIF